MAAGQTTPTCGVRAGHRPAAGGQRWSRRTAPRPRARGRRRRPRSGRCGWRPAGGAGGRAASTRPSRFRGERPGLHRLQSDPAGRLGAVLLLAGPGSSGVACCGVASRVGPRDARPDRSRSALARGCADRRARWSDTGTLPSSDRSAGADTDPTTLVGQGGSFLEPVMSKLLNDDAANLDPLFAAYQLTD